MRCYAASRWLAMSCLMLLVACGGGGSSGGGSNNGSSSAVSLDPNPISITQAEFSSVTLVIDGSLTKIPSQPGSPIVGQYFLKTVDSAGAFYASPAVGGSQSGFSITVQTLPWLAAGTHSGTLTVTVCYDSDCATPFAGFSTTVPYTVTVTPSAQAVHRLLPSTNSVAFASAPDGSVLSRTLAVHDNFGQATTWTAQSDSAWLKVSASGTSDATSLVVTADPTSLPWDQTSTATITLAADATGVSGATIHVGLWKGSTGLTTLVTQPTTTPLAIVGDPRRPLVYVTNGGTDVQVWNVHTAQQVGKIANVGAALSSAAVSPDGTRLFVLDGSLIRVVDLDSQSVVDTWTHASANVGTNVTSLTVVRPNGRDILLVGDGTAMADGQVLNASGLPGNLSVIDDGTRAYALETQSEPTIVTRYELRYADDAGGRLVVIPAAQSSSFNGDYAEVGQIAAAGDGSALYLADSALGCLRINPFNLQFESTVVANSLAIGEVFSAVTGATGNVTCGALQNAGAGGSTLTLGVYGGTSTALANYSIAIDQRTLQNGLATVASADGLVEIITDFDAIIFVPMGQGGGASSGLR